MTLWKKYAVSNFQQGGRDTSKLIMHPEITASKFYDRHDRLKARTQAGKYLNTTGDSSSYESDHDHHSAAESWVAGNQESSDSNEYSSISDVIICLPITKSVATYRNKRIFLFNEKQSNNILGIFNDILLCNGRIGDDLISSRLNVHTEKWYD